MNRYLTHAYVFAVICVSSLLVSGCAGEHSISLGYQPVGMQKAAVPLSVAVMKFADRRTNKTMGEIDGIFGMKTSLVLPKTENAGQWMAGAMAAELTQAGLQVTLGAVSPGTIVRIIGNVIEVHARMNDGIKAMVRADVIVMKDGMTVLAGNYTGQSAVAALAVHSADDYKRALESAMQNAMKKAVPDILAAIQ
jgi:hypothetical protein